MDVTMSDVGESSRKRKAESELTRDNDRGGDGFIQVVEEDDVNVNQNFDQRFNQTFNQIYNEIYGKDDEIFLEKYDQNDDKKYKEKEITQKPEAEPNEKITFHQAVLTVAGDDCVEFFQSCLDHGIPEHEWLVVDDKQNNLLHAAIWGRNPKAIQWLMENVDKDKKLSSGRNGQGLTPLETIEKILESARESIERGVIGRPISSYFQGFPPEVVSCLALLKGRAWQSPEKLLCLKYGCSCGECIDGFLSPRMKYYLSTHVEWTCRTFDPSWFSGVDESWYYLNSDVVEFASPDLQEHLKASPLMRHGFAGVFELIDTCLKLNRVPSVAIIGMAAMGNSEHRQVVRHFLENGGTVNSALRMIFGQARDMDDDPGEGGFYDIHAERILQLPACRNDHEFGFVALACGVEELGPN